MNIIPYELPDFSLMDGTSPSRILVWIPDRYIIVLGQSNRGESSVNLQAVQEGGIEVTQRPSGGETVLLSPNTLVISVLFTALGLENPRKYFLRINDQITKCLNELGVENLSQKGISDISSGDMKILGSSIYRKKGRVLYHAVLNVSEKPARIASYLAHPQREPDYRSGRKHEDFITSLHDLGCHHDIEVIREYLSSNLTIPEF